MRFDEVASEALKLDAVARAELADTLLASLGALSDEQNASEWADEAAQRDRAWNGSTARPAPEVFGDARRRLD